MMHIAKYWPTKAALLGLALAGLSGNGAHATITNFVLNGSFEEVTMPSGPMQINTTDVNDWSSSTAAFIFGANTANTVGSLIGSGPSKVFLNGNDSDLVSPDGGNFVGADGGQAGSITQIVTGLTAGVQYELTFDWAAAQQTGYTEDTSSRWEVSLGSQEINTAFIANPGGTFEGTTEPKWTVANMIFTATGPTEALTFLANGTPSGGPPFALLDGVSLVQVPEPTTGALLGSGLLGLAALWASRRARRSGTG